MASAFQTKVNRYIAPGVKGGWASANPHASLLQSNNGDLGETAAPIAIWMVGALGAIVGQFAFADTVTGEVTAASPGGPLMTDTAAGTVRVGFVQRDQFALITPYMAGSTQDLFEGQPITLLAEGDVWAEFEGGAAIGQFVFASYADGSAVAGATSTPPTTTFSVTTANGSPDLTAVGAGAAVGQPVTGTGIPAGARIIAVDTAANTAELSANATATGTVTATATTAAPTGYRVMSVAAPGDIAKISVQGA